MQGGKLVSLLIVSLLLLSFCTNSSAEKLNANQRAARELHKKYPIPYPYYCSSSADEERYYDAGWCPNKKMIGQRSYVEAAKEYQEWVDSLVNWVASMRNSFDKRIFGKDFEKLNVVHIETPHWRFATNMVGRKMYPLCLSYPLPKWLEYELKAENLKENRIRKLRISADADLAARIYAERLEYLYDVFYELFEGKMTEEEEGAIDLFDNDKEDEDEEPQDSEKDDEKVKDKDADHDYEITKSSVGGSKLGFYIWRTKEVQKRVSFAIANATAETGITLKSQYSLHTKHDTDGGNDDTLLHGLIHAASQVMLASYVKFEDDAVPCWFDEALAHWLEYKMMNSAKVCTRFELPNEITIPSTGLRKRVYQMVKDGSAESLASYADRDYDTLTPKQRVQSFGIVDYMIQDPEKMRKWILHVKNTKNQGEAFRNVYEITMAEFQDNWQAWVLETYKRAKD